jgi:uncharacterized protein YecE (DUF72 family)
VIRVGTAGWSLPTDWQEHFPEGDTHLHRYARVLDAVEINRTFKKLPRASTFARWADSVPEGFRFSVKVPREVTHDRRLEDPGEPLAELLGRAGELGGRLGPLLIQLPPSLEYDRTVAERFLSTLREVREGPDVLEARHESWFGDGPDALLAEHRVARVAADPPRAEADGRPGGFEGLAYFRLHGDPRTYYSPYRPGAEEDCGEGGGPEVGLEGWAGRLREAHERADEVWCVFDNTAAGEGTGDALAMQGIIEGTAQTGGAIGSS